jgi:hypothetical protein
MTFSEKTKEYLNKLLGEEEEKYSEVFSRWDELDPKTHFGIQNIKDFHLGYVFGSIEQKFIKWYYSEFGVSQSDEEYKEFWNICKSRLKSINDSVRE